VPQHHQNELATPHAFGCASGCDVNPIVLEESTPEPAGFPVFRIRTTIIYTHILKVAVGGAKSPLDALTELTS
jgi:hypothetical protein